MLASRVLVADSGPSPKAASATGFEDILILARALARVPHAVLLQSEAHGVWSAHSSDTQIDSLVLQEVASEAARRPSPWIVSDCLRESTDSPLRHLSDAGFRFFIAIRPEGDSRDPRLLLLLLDANPRALTAEQEEALAALGRHLAPLHPSPPADQGNDLRRLEEELAHITTRLEASEQLFRTFMDASPFASYIKDSVGRLLFYNKTYAQRFGISQHAWLGRTEDTLWSHTGSSTRPMDDLEAMHSGSIVQSEVRSHSKERMPSYWRTYRFPCRDSDGNLLLAGLALDITEEHQRKCELEQFQRDLQQANEQLRRLSVTDPLTGIRNRRAFEERLLLEFSMSRRRRRDLAVLLLDIDDFKQINDQWGHPAGDQVLKRVAAILRTTVRLPDMVARYGGEEFIILLPESNADSAAGLSRRLVERLAQEQWEHQAVTLSIGIAGLNDSLLNGYQLITMADEALYAAKRAGKNRAIVYGRAGSLQT